MTTAERDRAIVVLVAFGIDRRRVAARYRISVARVDLALYRGWERAGWPHHPTRAGRAARSMRASL